MPTSPVRSPRPAVRACVACSGGRSVDALPTYLPLPLPHAQLVVGTFVIAFIGNSFVDSAVEATRGGWFHRLNRLLPPPMRRRALVLLYFAGIISVRGEGLAELAS